MEIYVKPNNYPDKQILVVVKKDITFEELYSQIQENFKSMQEFKTISNISITNFSKKFAETGIKLPLKGPIEQHLKSGDIILCDIISEEYWLKTFFQLEVKKNDDAGGPRGAGGRRKAHRQADGRPGETLYPL